MNSLAIFGADRRRKAALVAAETGDEQQQSFWRARQGLPIRPNTTDPTRFAREEIQRKIKRDARTDQWMSINQIAGDQSISREV